MRKSLIAIAAGSLIAGSALAGESRDQSGSTGPSFDTLDTDRDGRISQAESAIDTNLVFSNVDHNSDGYLDKDEWFNRGESATAPQPQSTPDQQPPVSEPAPDTETPRQ